jgi:hypothetical protein
VGEGLPEKADKSHMGSTSCHVEGGLGVFILRAKGRFDGGREPHHLRVREANSMSFRNMKELEEVGVESRTGTKN